MRRSFLTGFLLALSTVLAAAQQTGMSSQGEPPSARLSNGQLQVRVYLPDAEKGFYRSTRFDWSGVIGSVQYQGHEFYNPWFTGRDAAVRDFIYKDRDIIVSDQSAAVGPVEEFRTALGFDTAKAGETFVKIGIGVLRKPDDARYSGYANYPIVDSGKWTNRATPDAVESTQEVNDPRSGYGYAYRKVVRLTAGKPELTIEHSLRNIGRLPIVTRQYNHNFLVLDKAPTSGDFVITLPFDIKTTTDLSSQPAAIRGKQIAYTKTFEGQDRVFFPMQGFGTSPTDYDVRVENKAIGAGVRVTSDRPLSNMSLWSIRSVISMEPDIDVNVAPGASMDWKYTYTYYTVPK
jgi:hypothetical protein